MAQAANSAKSGAKDSNVYQNAKKNLKSTKNGPHNQSGVIMTFKKQKTRKCTQCEKEIASGQPYFTESDDKNAPGYCQACVTQMQNASKNGNNSNSSKKK